MASKEHQEKEQTLLLAGHSYREVSNILNVPWRSVSHRNTSVYRIDLRAAFEARLKREGVPNRLGISNDFGYWFSGFFDGEGNLDVFGRTRSDGYNEMRLGIVISLRIDDIHVLEYIRDNLKCGVIGFQEKYESSQPKGYFRISSLQDLMEVVVPLFNQFPLKSKKAQEFVFWEKAVYAKYVACLGRGNQVNTYKKTDEFLEILNTTFERCKESILSIRHPPLSKLEKIEAQVQLENSL